MEFDYWGLSQDEHIYANGVESLLDDGKLYGVDNRYEENERVPIIYELPDWFDVNDAQKNEQLWLDADAILQNHFCLCSEKHEIELLTEEDFQEICKNPKYRKKVSTKIVTQTREEIKFWDAA